MAAWAIFGIVFIGLMLAQLAGPASVASGRSTAAPVGAPIASHLPAPSVVAGSSSAPVPRVAPSDTLTFPRTVLVETFTGVWCIHCPAESQALYAMDLNTGHNVLSIAELHVCAFPPGQGPCLENYVPPDGTADTRGTFYSVCGYPDVFFDGLHDVCGATNNVSQMGSWYQNNIRNASVYPGNVSISQSAVLTTNGSANAVTVRENITSGITGSYNLVTYLLEYVGKVNQSVGYGPHSVGNVVRMTIRNHPLDLTSGATTSLTMVRNIVGSWNPLNFSVISFVQQNSTRIIENANMAPVTTEVTSVTATKTTLDSGGSTPLTVHVTNTSTGYPLAGATVSLSSSAGGSFAPAGGSTDSNGDFTSTFTAPHVTATQSVVLTASVNATNYTADNGTASVLVNTLVPPAAVTGVTLSPGVGQVTINWTQPATGGTGLTYDIYQSGSQAGPYSLLQTSTSTSTLVSGLVAGTTLWFEVGAVDTGGYSPNSTAMSATSLTVSQSGLPTGVGFWFAGAKSNFTSPTGADLVVFMPAAYLLYQFGAASYAFVPAQSSMGTVSVAATPVAVSLAFSPRFAVLQGTVSPASATVSVDGTALAVSGGGFSWTAPAGTYTVTASASGYESNSTTVTLTPGNLTPLTIDLVSSGGGGPGAASSNAGLTGASATELIAGAVVIGVVAVVAAAVLMPKSGRGGATTRAPGGRPSYRSAPPSEEENP